MRATVQSVTVRFEDGRELTTQDPVTCSAVQRLIMAELKLETDRRNTTQRRSRPMLHDLESPQRHQSVSAGSAPNL